MQLNVEPDKVAVVIPDGQHIAVITDVKTTKNQYNGKVVEYLDLVLSLSDVPAGNGQTATIKGGYPLPIRPTSMSGQLLNRFGLAVGVGSVVDPELLRGKMCSVLTVQKPSKREPGKVYSEVIRETLKPYPQVLKL